MFDLTSALVDRRQKTSRAVGAQLRRKPADLEYRTHLLPLTALSLREQEQKQSRRDFHIGQPLGLKLFDAILEKFNCSLVFCQTLQNNSS